MNEEHKKKQRNKNKNLSSSQTSNPPSSSRGNATNQAKGAEPSTYKKRKDAVDHGKTYEFLTSALYALKFCLSDDVSEFSMITNSANEDIFDDVVMKATFKNGERRSFLFQLKHREKDEHILPYLLQSETVEKNKTRKNKFYLPLYLNSASTLDSEDENKTFIFYTNSKARIENGSSLSFKNYSELLVETCNEMEYKNLLLNPRHDESMIFQFKPSDDSNKEICKKFYFFSGQLNVNGTEEKIKEQLKSLYDQSDILDAYKNFFWYWWTENFVITKHLFLVKLAEFTLSPYIRTISGEPINDKTRLLKEVIMNFEMTIIDVSQEDIVRKCWTEIEQQENWKITPWNDSNPNQVQKSIILWYLDKVPLIIKIDSSNERLVKGVLKCLHKDNRKNSIIMLGNVEKDQFPEWTIFENLSDVKGICEKTDHWMEILSTFCISLQGREKISLGRLMEINDEEIAKFIQTKELFEMSQSDHLVIGKTKENLPTIHIPRNVDVFLIPMDEVFTFCKKDKENSIVIINCDKSSKEKISTLMKIQLFVISEHVESTKDQHIYFFIKKICTSTEFEEICKKTKPSTACILQVINEEFCILISAKEKHFFLSQKFKKSIPEDELHDYFKNSLKIFCAPPGVGKSTLMKVLSRNCPPERWAIDISLINQNSFLQKKPTFEEIFSKFLQLHEGDVLTKELKKIFWRNKNLEIFLDGLDELNSKHLNVIMGFIKFLLMENFSVWVSSRENLRERIRQTLHIPAMEIRNLNEEEQKTYIMEKLREDYESEKINEVIGSVFGSSNVTNSQELLGIPLQLHIITEIFLTNKERYENLKQEFFVLTKMYKYFFEGRKLSAVFKEGFTEEQADNLMDFEDRLKKYQILGLKSCLDNEDYEKLQINEEKLNKLLSKFKTVGDKYGIIRDVSGNVAIFDHQTFAEYFACCYFKKKKNKIMLLKDVIFSDRYRNLRKIFDIMLAEDNPLHRAVIYKNLQQFEKFFDEANKTDEGGRTALHLTCCNGTQNDVIEDSCGGFIKYKREIDFYKTATERLLKVTKIDQHDGLFDFGYVEYALQSGCIYPIEEMLKQNKFTKELKEDVCGFWDISFLLNLAADCGYSNLFSFLINNYPQLVNSDEKKTELLERAVRGSEDDEYTQREGNIAVVEILIKLNVPLFTILDYVCLHGIYDMLEILITHEANITDGETILHRLLKYNNKINDVVIKVAENVKININERNREGATPLHYACKNGDFESVKTLLINGADSRLHDRNHNTCLHYLHCPSMRYRDNTKIINLLMDSKNIDINAKNKFGATALHLACRKGVIENVKLLLDLKADVNVVDYQKNNILHYALHYYKDNSEIVSLLLDDENLDVNARNVNGVSPLHLACRMGIVEIVKRLLDLNADINVLDKRENSMLHYASRCYSKNEEIINLLIDKGNFDVNAQNKDGLIPLHLTCENGCIETMKLWLDLKADINVLDNKKNNALHYASSCGWDNTEMISLFLDIENFDVNVRNEGGSTPLHIACGKGGKENVKVLLEKGADINIVDDDSNTALHYAATFSDFEYDKKLVKLLLNKQIDFDWQNKNGTTALHLACLFNRRDIVIQLLDLNVNVHIIDNNGNTALHYATEHHEDCTLIIEWLLGEGVDVNARNLNGTTALELARERGHLRKVDKFLKFQKFHFVRNNL